MIQDFSPPASDLPASQRAYALVDSLLALLAVGLVAIGLDAVFHAMR